MTPKKRHLLDILRDEQSRGSSTPPLNTAVAPSSPQFRPIINPKLLAFVFVASLVFIFSYKFAGSNSNEQPVVTSAPPISDQRYCVLARSFDSQNLELARKLGTKLSAIGYNVQLAQRKVSSQEVVFELYVGDKSSQEALGETLAQLQVLTFDGLGGVSPFADARIRQLPKN